MKELQILNLTKLDELNQQQAKEIADGLMRSKMITGFTMTENRNVGYAGLASVIYNLSFAPKLVYLNASNYTKQNGNIKDMIESIYKMLRISTTIEILDTSYVQELNQNLNQDFFISLGEIRTLKVLEI